ncbi:MAG: TonB-dependent receptor [Sphingomonas sp.]|jgi:outer membrane receptor protein involved in Fe transport|uniref:TonB-dependent receptor n=1 Tax=Sphingomonas sp. TaxID=28214 RepID=UPI00356AFFBF
MRNRGRFSAYGAGTAVAAILCLAAMPAAAAAQQANFDIAAGDLRQALNAFARQSNREIIFSSTLVAGKRTNGVRGTLETEAALQALLQGTGLRAEGGSVLTLRKIAGSTGADKRRQPISFEPAAARMAQSGSAQDRPGAAASDAAAEPQESAAAPSEDVVVTGSRITRNGAEAPQPTTMVSRADIDERNPTNIADYINQLPQMGVGNTPRTTLLFANATGGSNQLNARGLGVTRTLTLLDGRRVVADGMISAVDVNLLPTNLVKRVDVVTGGASAVYGSDAVAGVVNFILDSEYVGLKGTVNLSETDHADGRVFTGDLAYGKSFAGGRGHILLSGSYFKGEGIDNPLGRDWYTPGYRLLPNPGWTSTNGQPGQIVRYDAGYNSTPGGVIASGPLKGVQFLPGGQIGQFTFGPIQSGQLQAGGTVEDTAYRWPLLPDDKHWSVYGRINYHLTDSINAIFEASAGGSDTINWSAVYNRQGASAITVSRDNPYLPAEARQLMVTNNVTTFTMNRLFYDIINQAGSHPGLAGYYRRQDRYLGALEGSFLGTGRWRAYFQHGHSHVWYTRDNNIIPSRFNLALDAIANPAVGGVAGVAVGAPICRSTLASPTNGCVPLNIFGEGSPSAAAVAYVTGYDNGLRTRQDIDFYQDVASLDGQYEPFSTWAGPVSIAAGFEWRKETFSASADPTSLASLWYVGNYKPGHGSYNVKEVFGEVLVPLLKDSALGKSLDFNGAVRRTDYSTSGAVTTWKAGLTYDITDGFRLRGTRSRDIRAPNLNDLYAPGSQFVNSYTDPTQPGSPTVSNTTISGGNPNLTPEIADTWTAGAIYRPTWLPGFTASIDWYKIKIKDAIVSIGAQQIINQCYGAGVPKDTASCSAIVLAPGQVGLTNATIYTGGINAQKQSVEGIDYEISYHSSLDRISASLPGALSMRLLVSQRLTFETELAGAVTNSLGLTGLQKWGGLLTTTYSVGRSRTTLTTRYIGPAKLSNYPSTSQLGVADNLNHVDPVWYFELAENYDLTIAGAKVTVFGVVENLFDRSPPPVPGSYLSFGTSSAYDLLGRTYRVGFRFKF